MMLQYLHTHNSPIPQSFIYLHITEQYQSMRELWSANGAGFPPVSRIPPMLHTQISPTTDAIKPMQLTASLNKTLLSPTLGSADGNIKQNNLHFENCALLGYYAACSGNFLPSFRDNQSVPPSRVKNGFLTITFLTQNSKFKAELMCLLSYHHHHHHHHYFDFSFVRIGSDFREKLRVVTVLKLYT
jgi:hypothetical protein